MIVLRKIKKPHKNINFFAQANFLPRSLIPQFRDFDICMRPASMLSFRTIIDYKIITFSSLPFSLSLESVQNILAISFTFTNRTTISL